MVGRRSLRDLVPPYNSPRFVAQTGKNEETSNFRVTNGCKSGLR
jgi:hypothetical protein